MISRGWRWYAAVVTLAVVGYLFVPPDGYWKAAVACSIGNLGTVGILVGTRKLAPRQRLPWWILAFGVLCSSSGGFLITLGVGELDGPDLSDYVYLAFYPACAIAVGMLVARLQRGIDWAALIDALTVTAGIALVDWIYAIQPALTEEQYSFADRVTIVAYPVCDLVLLAMTILLVRSNGRRFGPGPRLISLAISIYLVADWVWVVVGKLHPEFYEVPLISRGIDSGYLFALAMFGFASIWPHVDHEGASAAQTARLGPSQLIVLTGAVLIAPAVLVVQVLAGEVRNGLAIAVGSTAMYLLVIVRMVQLLRQSEKTSWQVRQLSRLDELTGLPNRRAWVDELPRVLEEARRDDLPVSIGMLDLDHFKAYNDRFGHPAGDRLLKASAAAWHSTLRRSDILARYGGEEFIVLLPGADIDHATAALERLKAVTPDGATFSAGVATWDRTETSEDLISRADEALYAAKDAGRDRVIAVMAL